jgi:hypothetical protein
MSAPKCVRLSVPMGLLLVVGHVLRVSSSPTPEDWVSGSPFSHFTSDDSRADIVTSAYLNVSRLTEEGWLWDKTEVGRFGGGYVGPAYGVVVHVTSNVHPEDHTGCQLPLYSSRTDGKLPPPGEPWIALIKRGGCNFEVKVENAFRSNAAGVLVYNDRDSATLDKMKLSSDSGRKSRRLLIEHLPCPAAIFAIFRTNRVPGGGRTPNDSHIIDVIHFNRQRTEKLSHLYVDDAFCSCDWHLRTQERSCGHSARPLRLLPPWSPRLKLSPNTDNTADLPEQEIKLFT